MKIRFEFEDYEIQDMLHYCFQYCTIASRLDLVFTEKVIKDYDSRWKNLLAFTPPIHSEWAEKILMSIEKFYVVIDGESIQPKSNIQMVRDNLANYPTDKVLTLMEIFNQSGRANAQDLDEFIMTAIFGEIIELPDLNEDEYDESPICVNCNGSGKGMYDGSRCSFCGGSGEVKVERNDW